MIESISRERLQTLLEAARGCRIAVIGDAMLDVYLRGDVDRISPEAPVPVVRITDRKLALGGAANVAQNITAIGATCEMICAVGDDPAGVRVRQMLHDVGADTRSIVRVARQTTTKTRVLARSQQLVRYDEEEDSDLDGSEMNNLFEAALGAVDRADSVILEDYNKGGLSPIIIGPVIARARARSIPVVVDPKYRNFFAYSGATIFKPNVRELESALGAEVDLDHVSALPAALERLGAENLLLTLGEKGMALVSADGNVGR